MSGCSAAGRTPLSQSAAADQDRATAGRRHPFPGWQRCAHVRPDEPTIRPTGLVRQSRDADFFLRVVTGIAVNAPGPIMESLLVAKRGQEPFVRSTLRAVRQKAPDPFACVPGLCETPQLVRGASARRPAANHTAEEEFFMLDRQRLWAFVSAILCTYYPILAMAARPDCAGAPKPVGPPAAQPRREGQASGIIRMTKDYDLWIDPSRNWSSWTAISASQKECWRCWPARKAPKNTKRSCR